MRFSSLRVEHDWGYLKVFFIVLFCAENYHVPEFLVALIVPFQSGLVLFLSRDFWVWMIFVLVLIVFLSGYFHFNIFWQRFDTLYLEEIPLFFVE